MLGGGAANHKSPFPAAPLYKRVQAPLLSVSSRLSVLMPRSTEQLPPSSQGKGRPRLVARRRRKVLRSRVSYLTWPARRRLARLAGIRMIFGLRYFTKKTPLPGAFRAAHVKTESRFSVAGPDTLQRAAPDAISTPSAGPVTPCRSSPGPSAFRSNSPTPGPSKERCTSPASSPCSGNDSESSSGTSPPRPSKRIYCTQYHPNDVSQWRDMSTLRSGRTVKAYDPVWIKRVKKKNPDWSHSWPLPGWVTSGERERKWFELRDALRKRRTAYYNYLRQEDLRCRRRRRAWISARNDAQEVLQRVVTKACRIQEKAEKDAREVLEKLVYWADKAVELEKEGKLLFIWPSGPSGKLSL